MFVTIGVIASLTVGMARATRRYDALSDRVQAVFHRQDAIRPSRLHPDEIDHEELIELLHKLDEVLARLPADRGASCVAHGPLSSSH